MFLNKKLEGYPFHHKGYYWDFSDNLSNLQRGQTPFSPATILFLQLHKRLLQLKAEGGERKNIGDVRHRAETFRKLCASYQWPVLAENPSHAITGFQTSDTGERKIFKGLIRDYDTYIMPGGRDGFYRVSHMGLQSDEDLAILAKRIDSLEKTIR